jgi:hypothetical protein
MTDMIQIKNSNLDSNNWVNCVGVTFKPSYKRILKINPLHGQFSGTNYLPAKGDQVGIENPVFSLRGVINLSDYSTVAHVWSTTPSTVTSTSEDAVSMGGVITLGYLIALWKDMTGTTYLKISFGSPEAQTTWKKYDLSTDEIPILIDNISLDPREDSEGGHFINYEITCHEVRV